MARNETNLIGSQCFIKLLLTLFLIHCSYWIDDLFVANVSNQLIFENGCWHSLLVLCSVTKVYHILPDIR